MRIRNFFSLGDTFCSRDWQVLVVLHAHVIEQVLAVLRRINLNPLHRVAGVTHQKILYVYLSCLPRRLSPVFH